MGDIKSVYKYLNGESIWSPLVEWDNIKYILSKIGYMVVEYIYMTIHHIKNGSNAHKIINTSLI